MLVICIDFMFTSFEVYITFKIYGKNHIEEREVNWLVGEKLFLKKYKIAINYYYNNLLYITQSEIVCVYTLLKVCHG